MSLTDRPFPDNVEENTLIIENRVGAFLVRTDVLRVLPDDLLRSVFSHFLIVRAEALFYSASIRYCAYSPLFAPVEEQDEPPIYEIIVNGIDEDMTVEVRTAGI